MQVRRTPTVLTAASLFIFVAVLIGFGSNDLSCFSPISHMEGREMTIGDRITGSVAVRFKRHLKSEFIEDSVGIVYSMRVDSFDGTFLWKTMVDQCVSRIDKWQCEMPYFSSTCAPNHVILFQFGQLETAPRASVSERDIENGFFVLRTKRSVYRYILDERGKRMIKNFFEEILRLVPEELLDGCK